MDIAIVTGAETPLGLRIVQSLNQQGCRVHGIGNNFSRVTYADPQFKAHPVDLTNLGAVTSTLGGILEEEGRLHVLIHAIDVTPGTPFDKLPPGNLEAILKIGLLGPVMMTRLALPNLLRFRGQLINVITANKHGNPASAANALIEGGLREMNKALFDQGRDAGLRVTNCVLRQNTELSGATVSDEVLRQSHIDLEDVARTIEHLIDPKAVNVPEEVVLHPRLSPSAEAAMPNAPLPPDAYAEVLLPPKEYNPPEQPRIPTEEKQQIERSIPYTDEEMEDKIAAAIEDFEANPHLYEQPDPASKKQTQGGGSQQEGQGKKKRRRRRGGRNRNKGPREEGAVSADGPQQPRAEQAKPAQESPKPEAKKEKSPESKPAEQPMKKKVARKAAKKKVPSEDAPVKKVAKKAAKKATTKKAAKKKTPAKKAAKKAAKKKAAKKTGD
ncbi:MAG: SDR family oxidoreductase [Verrucomicrobiota bacterium]